MILFEKNEPAFPSDVEGFAPAPGITIRTYLAAVAMQGILANGYNRKMEKNGAKIAVEWADALIQELNK